MHRFSPTMSRSKGDMGGDMRRGIKQNSYTVQLSISTSDDCNLIRSKDRHDHNKSYLNCSPLPLLIISLCLFSTILSVYENSTIIRFLKTPLSYISEPIYYRYELPNHIAAAINNSDKRCPRPFPRWGNSIEEENIHGIDIGPILDFIVNSSIAASPPGRTSTPRDTRYISTSDHGSAVGRWFPEVLYVLDHNGLHVSDLHRNIIKRSGNTTIRDKFVPTEVKMNDAYQILVQNTTYSSQKWPHLSSNILNNQSSSGFPFLLWYGDYTECNYMNWKNQYSIPLFTVAANDECNYTFPFPNYGTAIDSNNPSWDDAIKYSEQKYPWKNKIPKIVWRGSLTGAYTNVTHKSPRWNMVQQIYEMKLQYDNSNNHTEPFLFDVGTTRLPTKHEAYTPYLDEVGGIINSMPMEDFQKYRGVLDIDGNSWSSRFGRLLCYNSVVLKVEPRWVEYFYYKNHSTPFMMNNSEHRSAMNHNDDDDVTTQLRPWVHYIPIKRDLSNLIELSQFVVDPKHDPFLMKIIRNANMWCKHNLIRKRVSIDMLNIWERYIQLITTNNPDWVQNEWAFVKETIFDPQLSLFNMNQSSIGVY